MVKTKHNITSPLPDTEVKPVYTYNDEQTAMLTALREVCCLRVLVPSACIMLMWLVVCANDRTFGNRSIPYQRTGMASQARYDTSLYESR